jgi:hypothetical protein
MRLSQRVRRDAGEERLVGRVAHAELAARLLHHLRQRRVVHVADAVEQVVLDLKIQATKEPAKDTVLRGEVSSFSRETGVTPTWHRS